MDTVLLFNSHQEVITGAIQIRETHGNAATSYTAETFLSPVYEEVHVPVTGNPVMCSNSAYGNPKRIMLEENPAYISHNTSSSSPPRKYYFVSSGIASDKSQHTP